MSSSPEAPRESDRIAGISGRTTTESGIIVPDGVRGRRETIRVMTEEELRQAEAPSKYNTQGVNFDDRHNFFYQPDQSANTETQTVAVGEVTHSSFSPEAAPTSTEKGAIEEVAKTIDGLEAANAKLEQELVGIKSELAEMGKTLAKLQELIENRQAENDKSEKEDEAGKKELAADQPRHTRSQDGKTIEKKVKYADGSFEWVVVGDGDEELEVANEDQNTELVAKLQSALGRYAELTAKERNGYVGHFLKTSRFLVKIPGVKMLAESINNRTDSDLMQAKLEYEKAVDEQIQAATAELFDGTEESIKRIMLTAGASLSNADRDFEERLVAERMSQSKKTDRFVNWWVRQSGLGGQFKKYLAVAGAGAAAAGTGVAVGALAGSMIIPGAGAIVGGAVGAYIAGHVAKRRANSVDSEGVTLAQRQSNEDITRKREISESSEEAGTFASPDELTAITEERTARQKAQNRGEMKMAAGAGAAGGAIAEGLVSLAADQLAGPDASAMGVDATSDATPSGSDGYTPDTTAAEAAPTPEQLLETTFDVESGSGYVNELQQFASANGHALSPEQAWQLHQDMVAQYGGDYLDIASTSNDVYQTPGGDWRLSAPGQASWDPGVAEAIKANLVSKGLW